MIEVIPLLGSGIKRKDASTNKQELGNLKTGPAKMISYYPCDIMPRTVTFLWHNTILDVHKTGWVKQ